MAREGITLSGLESTEDLHLWLGYLHKEAEIDRLEGNLWVIDKRREEFPQDKEDHTSSSEYSFLSVLLIDGQYVLAGSTEQQ